MKKASKIICIVENIFITPKGETCLIRLGIYAAPLYNYSLTNEHNHRLIVKKVLVLKDATSIYYSFALIYERFK